MASVLAILHGAIYVGLFASGFCFGASALISLRFGFRVSNVLLIPSVLMLGVVSLTVRGWLPLALYFSGAVLGATYVLVRLLWWPSRR